MKKSHSHANSEGMPAFNSIEEFLEREDQLLAWGDHYDLVKSCQVLIEWIVRIPHVEPFPLAEKIKKDISGINKYRYTLIDTVREIADSYILDADLEIAPHLDASPYVHTIHKTISEWLGGMEKAGISIQTYKSLLDFKILAISSKEETIVVFNDMNKLSHLLRTSLMDAGFRDKNHSFTRNASKRYSRMLDVAKQSWERHARILLIRIDWGFKKCVPDLRGKFLSKEDFNQRFREVSEYRKMQLNELELMFGSDLIFNFWKIECTTRKGLHIHWLIGVNGAKHQDRINVPRMICDAWDKTIGNPLAYSWNVNASQKNDDATLRVVRYDEPLWMQIFQIYANYLCKVDYLIRHRRADHKRSFGGTQITKEKKVKRGPKRKEVTVSLAAANTLESLSGCQQTQAKLLESKK